MKDFKNYLPDNSIVYFHNLGYDSRMFSEFDIQSSIDKGTKTMSQKMRYEGKNIIFKNSLSIINIKLLSVNAEISLISVFDKSYNDVSKGSNSSNEKGMSDEIVLINS